MNPQQKQFSPVRHRLNLLVGSALAIAFAHSVAAEVATPSKEKAATVRAAHADTSHAKARRHSSRIGVQPTWRDGRFVYRAESKRIAEVLQDFAGSQGIPAIVAPDLEGTVNGNFDVDPKAFLENMSRIYNFIWYHDGTALYFYPARSIQSRIIRLKGYRRQQVQNLLQSLEVEDKRWPLRYDEAQNTLYVSGPPRHLELVTSALEALDSGIAEGIERVVQVFPLRFSTAADRTSGGVVVPGVASMLRKLFANGSSPAMQDPAVEQMNGVAANLNAETEQAEAGKKRMGMQPMVKLGEPPVKSKQPPVPQYSKGGANGKAGRGEERGDDTPVIEADEANNTIVIHGRADRMAEYGTLIERLDQKPMLVELVATIIEVSADSANSLGINWSLSNSRGNVAMNGPQSGGSIPGFTLSAVLANAGRELLARVDALQAEGKARILSKPLVLGVANRTAIMREKRIASVRVSGSRDANLFQIEAGTLLEMTPQVTASDGINRVKLSIYIEDGNFESSSVDQIPIIKKTEIRTEAHVREGESLLIGGITVESEQSVVNGVPGLSRVPLVGAAFRNTDSHTHRTERMFLITPRLPGSPYSTQVATNTPPAASGPAPAIPAPARPASALRPADDLYAN
ncbi:MAG TPA: type III secretion system outer membrane ring subunit SctC [Burkholderiaceae bacterium]|nr:type III secretion system outer membrane ring subunit SctC [Burkholderiaceae bacterium]